MYIFPQKEFLLFSLVVTGIIFLLANILHEEQYPIIENHVYFTDILFIIIPLIVIILSSILVIRYGITGSHSISWILFTVAIGIWFVAEQSYTYNAEFKIGDIRSYISDLFYVLGYIIFFVFTVFYLKPMKNKISKNIILFTVLISSSIFVPTLYFVYNKPIENSPELVVNTIYPILDGMILAPSLIAIILFFRGEVNFLWVTISLGIIFDVAGDTTYLIERYNETFSVGSIADLFFIWTYVFFAFGVHDHVKMFRIAKKN
jgi:hypothetical protein